MMRRIRRYLDSHPQQRANSLASLVGTAALTFLYLETPPVPAGADVLRLKPKMASIVSIIARKPSLPTLETSEPSGDAVVSQPAAAPTPEQLIAQALQKKIDRLKAGVKFLEQTSDYTAVFTKQELVAGELLDEQEIQLKVRHAPFSVYLKWMTGDKGREVLYVDGQNEGRMVVHAGGWKARLPALTIDPHSSLAMGESRYPVTKAGILELAKTMIGVHQTDIAVNNLASCIQGEDQEFGGRPCECFQVEYRDQKVSPTYRKSITLIDKEWGIPVYAKNYAWPTDSTASADPAEVDEATLVEFYSYTEIELSPQFADADFDRSNEEYRFR